MSCKAVTVFQRFSNCCETGSPQHLCSTGDREDFSDNCRYEEVLDNNGYEVIEDNISKSLKLALLNIDVPEIHFGNIAKNHQLWIVDIQMSVLNEEMDSESLKLKILDAISASE